VRHRGRRIHLTPASFSTTRASRPSKTASYGPTCSKGTCLIGAPEPDQRAALRDQRRTPARCSEPSSPSSAPSAARARRSSRGTAPRYGLLYAQSRRIDRDLRDAVIRATRGCSRIRARDHISPFAQERITEDLPFPLFARTSLSARTKAIRSQRCREVRIESVIFVRSGCEVRA
jgi:hypothetical protein